MELIIKLVWTLVAAVMIWGISAFTIKIWRSHVDPAATFDRVIASFQKEPTELIATREDDALYQHGQVVGRVTGKITEAGNVIIFEEVVETSKLNQNEEIEFRRLKIKLDGYESFVGMKVVSIIGDNATSSSMRTAVISDARCRIISKK